MENQRCINCKAVNETVEMRQRRGNKRVPLCTNCWSKNGKVVARALVRFQHDREAIDRDLRKTYGISIEDYERLVLLQRGRCAICRKHPGPDRRLAVDHDHRHGHVRGLLCHKCNTAVGLLGDSPAVADRLAGYLNDPPSVHALGVRIGQSKGGVSHRPPV